MSWVGMSCLLFDHRFFSSVQEAGSREDGACEQMCWSTLQAGDRGCGGVGVGQGLDAPQSQTRWPSSGAQLLGLKGLLRDTENRDSRVRGE